MPDKIMQSAKEYALRRFPKLSRWIFAEAEPDHAAVAAFALGLNKRLADDAGRSGNLVYSPLSVYAALSLVAAGAPSASCSASSARRRVTRSPARPSPTGPTRSLHRKDTKEDKFHRLDGTDIDVPFMRGFGSQLVACHDGFKVLQLYYEQGRFLPAQPAPLYSMCVFLPGCGGSPTRSHATRTSYTSWRNPRLGRMEES